MAYYVIQHQILFHDTMAYGSHHHSANIKFQNIARESLLFSSVPEGQAPWQEQLANIILLTREAYSLNLAPAFLGEKVAIFTTYENPTRSTVRLCFRTIGEKGQPISCGYQTMIVLDKDTQEVIPGPPLLTQYLDPNYENSLIEELTEPNFCERIHLGSRELKNIFSDEIRELGKREATAPPKEAYAKFVHRKSLTPQMV